MKKFFPRMNYRQFISARVFFMLLILPFACTLLGSSLSDDGNIILSSGGSLNNQGTLVILGNLTNNGSAILGPGTIKFSGSSAQNVTGTNIFQNLEVDNSSGITIGGSTTVNGNLSMTNGLITLGENNLFLGSSANISGTPGPGKMIVATGSGELRKKFSGTGSFIYPVGDNSGTAEYSPVTLAFTAGTFSSDNWAGVNLVNEAYPGSSISYLNRYWNVTSVGITDFSCDAQYKYNYPADISGTESDIYCIKVQPGPEVICDVANTSLHQLTSTGLSSFGTFTGRLWFRYLTIGSLMLEGLYNGSGMMRKAFDEYGEHFSGDTADVIGIELHSAADYSVIKYLESGIGLSTSGSATLSVPHIFNESYFVTIRHRNSLETVSSVPVNFTGTSVNYDFDLQSKAYGNNLGLMLDGTAVIYAGDENQDRIVDGTDMNNIGNMNDIFATGYIPEDINGDGLVDGSDMNITNNNNENFIASLLP